ncbi:nucleotide exchange factor GrpE [Thermosynechococcus sichuanensis E542]|uniref:Nucleotide exchange factor GrpE n=1 Tax=Thermosynechococcus sichuanensis E542 TaxID=2016101 RepID=A0A3B7MDZ4_9CYAN|nr:nucleotide exchange factor GrpE [Thermosynechococcus vestitus]AXY68102.1 nucleotide exchange factor GrpE [Thermosynechococcus vestitus E542]
MESKKFLISEEQKKKLLASISQLMRENTQLSQNIRQINSSYNSKLGEFLLELLEIYDSLESLSEYLSANPDPPAGFLQRLPRNLTSIKNRFLAVLESQGVSECKLEEYQFNPNFCRAIDVIHDKSYPDNKVVKVLKKGYLVKDLVLRPYEVIVNKLNK